MSNISERTFDDVFSDLPSSRHATSPNRKRRWLIVLGVFAAVGLLFTGGGYLVLNHVASGWDENIERIGDPFSRYPTAPARKPTRTPAML